jgi:hypothetical protein
MDISDTTALETDVIEGKEFYKADGNKAVGNKHDYLPDLKGLMYGFNDDPSHDKELVFNNIGFIRAGFMKGNQWFEKLKISNNIDNPTVILSEAFKDSNITEVELDAPSLEMSSLVFDGSKIKTIHFTDNCKSLNIYEGDFGSLPDLEYSYYGNNTPKKGIIELPYMPVIRSNAFANLN